jgi:hypothetical protein
VLDYAPDPAAAKAGQQLALERHWSNCGSSDDGIWGECQGSGIVPYQTIVDLREIAFKCSCPSRKFPCKHGLALLLLYTQAPAKLGAPPTAPAWATEWLQKRGQKAIHREEIFRDVETEAVPPNPKKELQKTAQRNANVTVGIAELTRFLRDLMREGFAELPSKGYSYWDNMAARMVDAQAPGLARRLRDMGGLPSSGVGWQQRLLDQVTLLHLLMEGYGHIEDLPEELKADIRTNIGWTVSQESLLAAGGIKDDWTVVGIRVVEEDRLRARRAWLYGTQTQKCALLLNFAHGSAGFDPILSTGMSFAAELIYFPSAYPIRGLLKSFDSKSAPPVKFHATLVDAFHGYLSAIAEQPWVEQFPMAISSVTPQRQGNAWHLVDADRNCIPLSRRFDRIWHLQAACGGKPTDLFGEWDGSSLWPMATIQDGSPAPI